ncbi:MAG: ACP S-malonyltransferase [Clostridium sp.]|nr:ACP S-malonyltransferase [Acetatifactor muris]MCM1528088.1 ACP S-malonyltransferase [Bacteroides sp.]MCM1562129.1 ACP S-malonyltransferase [Clostridium sp.]
MSKIAFIYPGQGAQKAGMGLDFYRQFASAREVYEKAGAWLGMDVKALCFEENDRLDLTQYTQAAMVTTSMAMERVIGEKGLHPDMAAGLSLGEYCAIATAGAMSLRDAIVTVRKRGILMEQAVPAGQGGMAAVLGMAAEEIGKILEPIPQVSIANYNCPGQIVITGMKESLQTAGEALEAAGARRVIPLAVSGPFHSEMLAEAGRSLARELEQVRLEDLKIPYVTNVTAELVQDTAEIRDLLARQISSPVRWQQSVERMIQEGADTFIEIGPGRTLSGFVKKISRDVKVYNIETVSDMEEVLARL